MTTGDIRNNIRKLQTEIKQLKYSETVDIANFSKGVATAFLPLYHYAFTQYSTAIAEKISAMDIELFGKSDLRFMELVYKILRDMFNYKPLVTKDQFFSPGFAERKVIMTTEVLGLIRAKKKELQPPIKSMSSLRVNSSMDSLNNHSGQTRTKSAETRRISMIETKARRKVAIESVGRTNRTGKVETFRLTRPSSAPAGKPPKATAIKHKAVEERSSLDLQDSEIYGGTPSIIRVRPAAVEVVRLPRDGECNSSSISPANLNSGQEEISIVTNQMTELCKTVKELVSRVSLLEIPETKIASPVGHSSMIQPNDLVACGVGDVKTDITQIKQQQETILARLVLLENRMAMMEAKMVPSDISVSAVNNCDSPVSTVKNSNRGAFVCVESFVHGDKTVKKLQTSPEKPVHNLAYEYQTTSQEPRSFSPVLQLNGVGHVESTSPVNLVTPDSDDPIPASDNASPPIKVDLDSNPCQFIDESTQNKVERIKNLFNETDGMLKNIGVPNTLLDNLATNHQAKDLDADVDEKELEVAN